MTELEKQRLQDFRMVLRYHLCSKIKHFHCTPREFYAACRLYTKFKQTHVYSKRVFELLAFVNASGLHRAQLRAIFGYGPGRKWIEYKELIEQSDITVRKHGTQYCKKTQTRRQFANCYFLPYDEIAKVFEDADLLDKVLDATSDLYTPRQRCLIFNQIIGVEVERDADGKPLRDSSGRVKTIRRKSARYKSKTNKEILEERASSLSDAELESLIDDIDL